MLRLLESGSTEDWQHPVVTAFTLIIFNCLNVAITGVFFEIYSAIVGVSR
jgi:hypothetical protein